MPRTGSKRFRATAALTTGALAASGLAAVFGATVLPAAPASAADGPAWTCSADGYLFQAANGQATIQQVDLVSGAASQIATTASQVNAVGYNTLDNYMYGIDSSGSVIAIAQDGTLTDLGNPGLDSSVNWQSGDFDDAGHLWVTSGGASGTDQPYYEIDLSDPSSSTYGTIIDSGTLTRPTGFAAMPSDWVFTNGAFYGLVGQRTGAGEASLVRFDPATGAVTVEGTIPGTANEDRVYGAGYADSNGYLYFSNNTSGNIYRVDPTDGSAIALSDGPAASGNDGARCADAPIPTVTVVKDVGDRVRAADQFTVGLDNSAGETLDSATTTGTNTTATTTDWPVSQNATYTITDAMTGSSPSAITEYDQSIACVDGAGNPVTTGGDPLAWTLAISAATNYTCTVTNTAGAPSMTYSKTASTDTAAPGDTVTYTVTVKNTGAVSYTDANPAGLNDDLSKVLDDGTYNDDATGGATIDGNTLSWRGPLDVGQTRTFTYSVTVNTPDTGDKTLENALVPPTDVPGTGCDPDASCTTITNVPTLEYKKTSDKVATTPGGVVHYTVTVTNTGTAPYTTGDPASFDDDLSKVLDDAKYNNDASDGATVSGQTLSWSGPLDVGQSKDITYSVTVNDPVSGDKKLVNAVTSRIPGSGCDPDASCTTTTDVGSYTVTKSVDKTKAAEGDTVTYTVTVKNTGDADYTASSPASFKDDMSEVLDDATYNEDASNGATFEEKTLSWSGPLAVGQTIKVTYSVTVNTPDTGDRKLHNVVTSDGCDTAASCETNTPIDPANPPAGPSVATGGTMITGMPAWPWIGTGALALAGMVTLGMMTLRRRHHGDAGDAGEQEFI